jgi:hypothetical protein
MYHEHKITDSLEVSSIFSGLRKSSGMISSRNCPKVRAVVNTVPVRKKQLEGPVKLHDEPLRYRTCIITRTVKSFSVIEPLQLIRGNHV